MRLRLIQFVGIVLLFGDSTALAADDPRQKMLNDWTANRTRFQSVRYTLSGVWDIKDPYAGAKPKNPKMSATSQPWKATVLIDFTTRRFRIESSRPRPTLADRNKWAPAPKINTYNGKSEQTYHTRDPNVRPEGEHDLSIVTGDLRQHRIDSLYWPLLAAHGFVPTVWRRPYPHRFPDGHELDEFLVQGGGRIGGRNCAIIRTEPDGGDQDEYWVDPARANCIVRQIYFSNKTNPFYRFDIEYQQLSGAWLPKKWTQTFSENFRVCEIERTDVTNVELDPTVSDDDFTIPITPGMIVKEYHYPDAGKGLDPQFPATKTSRAKPSGELEVVAETGFTTKEGKQLPPEREWRWWWIALAVGGVLVLALGGGWMWRKRRGSIEATG
ncbi:MAG: hypothetical protein L0241_10935 [Planctomycetia bacterium]|nr:hypothetical protein [Planctomycetia bacterium]